MRRTSKTASINQKLTHAQFVEAERLELSHWALEKAIVDLCGVTPLTDRYIDLLVNRGACSVIFEVKACSLQTVGRRVREAIYQLLEYRFIYREHLSADVRLCVVSERLPSGKVAWLIGYMESLGIGMIWKDEPGGLACSTFTKGLLRDVLPAITSLPSPSDGRDQKERSD